MPGMHELLLYSCIAFQLTKYLNEQALSKADGRALDIKVQECLDIHGLLACKIRKLAGFCEAFMSTTDAQAYLSQLFQTEFSNARQSDMTDFLDFLMMS